MTETDLVRSPRHPEIDRVLFAGRHVLIGHFRVAVGSAIFHDTGAIQNHLVVFPRTSVRIRHEGRPPFVADPSIATIYNRGQIYRREVLSAEGDRCDWIAVDPRLACSIAERFDPRAAEAPENPFRFPFAPVAEQLYLRQRLLVQEARAGALEDLEVEEEAMGIVAEVLTAAGAAFGKSSNVQRIDPQPLAEDARELLARTFTEPLSLVEIADRLGCSPYHLCHCFRRATGVPLHGYRMQLRLRTALERLSEADVDLTELALDLGYSSHSHFSTSFRRFFGATPSKLRAQLRPQPVTSS